MDVEGRESKSTNKSVAGTRVLDKRVMVIEPNMQCTSFRLCLPVNRGAGRRGEDGGMSLEGGGRRG